MPVSTTLSHGQRSRCADLLNSYVLILLGSEQLQMMYDFCPENKSSERQWLCIDWSKVGFCSFWKLKMAESNETRLSGMELDHIQIPFNPLWILILIIMIVFHLTDKKNRTEMQEVSFFIALIIIEFFENFV